MSEVNHALWSCEELKKMSASEDAYPPKVASLHQLSLKMTNLQNVDQSHASIKSIVISKLIILYFYESAVTIETISKQRSEMQPPH